MSYNFYLFDAGDSGDPVAAAHEWLAQQERIAIEGAPARGAAPPRVDELRALLGRQHPELRAEGVPPHMPSAPRAQLADAGTGTEIRLYDDSVAVTLPLWHDGQQAEQVLRRVSGYLSTVRQATGFVVYDPQQDAVVEPDAGLPGVMQRYTGATQTVRRLAEQLPGSPRAAGRRGTQARSRPRSEERLRDPAAFGEWVAAMDDLLEAFLTTLPREVAGRLDFTPRSLDVLERWILDRFASVDEVFAESETLTHDYLARYVGETIRRNAGGEWHISYDDPKSADDGVPVIRFAGPRAPVAPKYLVSASVDRRTGRYLSTVTANIIGVEPPRNPNV